MYFQSAEDIDKSKVVRFPALGWNSRNNRGEVFVMVKSCSMQDAIDKYKMNFACTDHPEQIGILYRWVNKDTGSVCTSWLNEYDSRLEMHPAYCMGFTEALQAMREGYVVARNRNRLLTFWCNMDCNLIIHRDVEAMLSSGENFCVAKFTTDDVLATDWAIVDTVLNELDYPTLPYVKRDPATGFRVDVDEDKLNSVYGVPFKLLKIKHQKDKAMASVAAETAEKQKEG